MIFNNILHTHHHSQANVRHELTHTSQVRRMLAEKGLLWASDYWSANVYQQASNTIYDADDSPYGHKGNPNWQIIALSEGWANFRAWRMCNEHLGWPDYLNLSTDPAGFGRYFTDRNFPRNYGAMYDSLVVIGCSYQNIEKALCAYSVGDFRNNLINKYPYISEEIRQIISIYE